MEILPQVIPEILVVQPKSNSDERGYFIETFRKDKLEDALGFKVHFVQDEQLNSAGSLNSQDYTITSEDVDKKLSVLQANKIPNPLAVNMYTLGFDSNKKLSTLTETTKQNLKTYLSQYRMVTDAINIKNAYIINIGINFAILTKANFNKNDVLLRCVATVKDFFNIDRWQIGQPIVLGDIAYELSLVDGVASVVPPIDDNPDKHQVLVKNLFDVGQGYSGNIYDMENSLKGGVLYPALDPSIFEVRFPDIDIQGRGTNVYIHLSFCTFTNSYIMDFFFTHIITRNYY